MSSCTSTAAICCVPPTVKRGSDRAVSVVVCSGLLRGRVRTLVGGTSSSSSSPVWGTPHHWADIPRYSHEFLCRPNHFPPFPSISLIVRPLSEVSVRPHTFGLRRAHPDLDAPLRTIRRTLRPQSCPFPSLCRSLLVRTFLILLAISFRTRVTMVTLSFSFIFLNIPLT